MRIKLGYVLATAFLVLACQGATSSTVIVELDEWNVRPDRATVPAGQVTFDARNVGSLVHELVIIKTDRAPDSLVVEGTKVDEGASGQTVGEIEEDELGPGQEASATFDLSAGKYILFCNIEGHYQSGMLIGFVVE